MNKYIDIQIHPDGRISAETLNMVGEECLVAPEILLALVDATITDSHYLSSYYQAEQNHGISQENIQRENT
jgi:hypothetical protein